MILLLLFLLDDDTWIFEIGGRAFRIPWCPTSYFLALRPVLSLKPSFFPLWFWPHKLAFSKPPPWRKNPSEGLNLDLCSWVCFLRRQSKREWVKSRRFHGVVYESNPSTLTLLLFILILLSLKKSKNIFVFILLIFFCFSFSPLIDCIYHSCVQEVNC